VAHAREREELDSGVSNAGRIIDEPAMEKPDGRRDHGFATTSMANCFDHVRSLR